MLWATAAQISDTCNNKKQPHAAQSGCNQPHKVYNPIGIQQMAPPEHTSNKQAYYSFIDPEKMKG